MEEGIAVVVTGKSGVVVRTEKSLSSEKVVELAVGTRAVQISTSSITNADGGEVERAEIRWDDEDGGGGTGWCSLRLLGAAVPVLVPEPESEAAARPREDVDGAGSSGRDCEGVDATSVDSGGPREGLGDAEVAEDAHDSDSEGVTWTVSAKEQESEDDAPQVPDDDCDGAIDEGYDDCGVTGQTRPCSEPGSGSPECAMGHQICLDDGIVVWGWTELRP